MKNPFIHVFSYILAFMLITQHCFATHIATQSHSNEPIPINEQLSFTILIYAHNAAQWVKKNLDSVFNQKYTNYRIIYVDDASTDATMDLVKEYNATVSNQHFELIRYDDHQGELKSMYTILNNCSDKEIILLLNGHDWLANHNVLTKLHNIYTTYDILLTFGTCTSAPKGCNIGVRNGEIPQHILNERLFRDIFPYMPARSFYAWLFKLIKKEDLIDPATGDFYAHAAECYIMWPLLEMASTRFKAIEAITYVINCHDPIAKLEEDYYLRMAINSQMDKDFPIYPTVTTNACPWKKDAAKSKNKVVPIPTRDTKQDSMRERYHEYKAKSKASKSY